MVDHSLIALFSLCISGVARRPWSTEILPVTVTRMVQKRVARVTGVIMVMGCPYPNFLSSDDEGAGIAMILFPLLMVS